VKDASSLHYNCQQHYCPYGTILAIHLSCIPFILPSCSSCSSSSYPARLRSSRLWKLAVADATGVASSFQHNDGPGLQHPSAPHQSPGQLALRAGAARRFFARCRGMGDIKSRLRTKLFRRASSTAVEQQQQEPSSPTSTREALPDSPTSATNHADHHREPPRTPTPARASKTRSSTSSLKERDLRQIDAGTSLDRPFQHEPRDIDNHRPESLSSGEHNLESSIISIPETLLQNDLPAVTIQEATPGSPPVQSKSLLKTRILEEQGEDIDNPLPVVAKRYSASTGVSIERKQSLVAGTDVGVIEALLHDESHPDSSHEAPSHQQPSTVSSSTVLNPSMLHRKVWVKRPGAAATIVLIREDDLVDDAKDAILRKYANSIGRHYDAPDVTIRITIRGQPGERVLSPDEPMCRTIDSHYPGGQTIDEALILDIPPKRTPRHSPRLPREYYYQQEDSRPHESGNDYFPQMPAVNLLGQPSPLLTSTSHDSRSHDSRQSHGTHERAMSVLNTGQVPSLPSPGGRSSRTHLSKHNRPNYPRQHTSSPTTLTSSVSSRANRPRLDSSASAEKHPAIAPQPAVATVPTPPVPEQERSVIVPAKVGTNTSGPPTPRVASPRPGAKRSKMRQKQPTPETNGPSLPPNLAALLDTSVPPINVLIVEDNMINMRLLEQFVRRLGVRWQTAVNGREAVDKWRQGGFHLVLMDIQLPIMSGLEATKEIRRLERVNNIGVFSSASSSSPEVEERPLGGVREEDGLGESADRLFKSPVIIVALTASNLQSDRHEALAAGCNDFLTKASL
jgi:osomolarity two-component system response regulator SSK1